MKTLVLILSFIGFSCLAQGNDAVKTAVTKNGITVQTYNFKALEPLFHRQNDTIYVINFWATWCAPCVKELPFFEKLNSVYKNKKVKVLLVSLDMKKQVESSLLPFIKRKNIQSEVVHLHDPDADAWVGKVDGAWSGALPATLIYNKGQRKFYEQSFTYEALEKEVKQFIN